MSRCSPVTDDLDTIFDLLYDSRRRYLLYYLVTGDSDVVELTAAVTAVRNYEAAGTETAGRPSREEVRSDLHLIHLPRLANASVLDYDRRQGTIRLTGHSELEHWVEHAHSKEIE